MINSVDIKKHTFFYQASANFPVRQEVPLLHDRTAEDLLMIFFRADLKTQRRII
ncbi:hypothetical protein BMS3Abin03_02032 [bacterium BMS3Abin03]|nr:hypothetical protein BMS3Abin03_02032 [bacterium BMS3Abin03]